MYQIKYQDFEGPLDLLLDLIEKNKLDITQLSLAKVADDYLAYIEEKGDIDIANLSSFLLTASHLILLKSKALLPLFEFNEEEEEEVEDLQERLRLYQKFKKISIEIKLKLEERAIFFSKPEEHILFKKFMPIECGVEDFKEIFENLIQNVPEKQELEKEVVRDVVSLEERIVNIKKTLEKRVTIAFRETLKDTQDKMELIVSFLAMLEMIKQKFVFVQQESVFSDMSITKR